MARVLPALPPAPAARLLPALRCLRLTATPLQAEAAAALLEALLPRLHLEGDEPASSTSASDARGGHDEESDEGRAEFPGTHPAPFPPPLPRLSASYASTNAACRERERTVPDLVSV